MSATIHGILISLLLVLLSASTFNSNEVNLPTLEGSICTQNQNGTSAGAGGEVVEEELVPLIDDKKVKMLMVMNETRRRLGSFQICAACTCCGGSKGYCLPSPCCYAINCNIPNKPFGFCSFTPKSCNCFGCHL